MGRWPPLRSDLVGAPHMRWLCVLLVATVATGTYALHHTQSEPVFEHAFVEAGKDATTKFLIDYTRVFVPSHNELYPLHGHFRTNDWVSVTFVLNEGLPILDAPEDEDAFAPLVCLYRVLTNHGDPSFQGCFTGVTTLLPRLDSLDPVFVEGAEVYFASRILLQLIRGLNVLPTYDLSFVSNDYCSDAALDDEDEDHWHAHTLVRARIKMYIPTYLDRIFSEYNMLPQSPYTMNESVHFFRPVVALNTYFKSFVSRDYQSFRPFLAEDISFEVVGLTNYSGSQLVYFYQLLADADISDVIRINGMGLERIYQQGHTIMMQVMMLSEYIHTPKPLAIWNNKYAVHVQFDRYGNIKRFVQHVNLLDAFIRKAPLSELNITLLCETIQGLCTEDIIVDQFLPELVTAVQYHNISECNAYLHSIPLAGPTAATPTTGKSVACVNWHVALAHANPVHHCVHVGPLRIDVTKTPCQDF